MAEDSRCGGIAGSFAEAVLRMRKEQPPPRAARRGPSCVPAPRKTHLPQLKWVQKVALNSTMPSNKQRKKASASAKQIRKATRDYSFHMIGNHLDSGASASSRAASKRRVSTCALQKEADIADLGSCQSTDFDKIDVSGSGVLARFPSALSVGLPEMAGGEEPFTDMIDSGHAANEALLRIFEEVGERSTVTEQERLQHTLNHGFNGESIGFNGKLIGFNGESIGFNDSVGSQDDLYSIVTEMKSGNKRTVDRDSSLITSFQPTVDSITSRFDMFAASSASSVIRGESLHPLSLQRPQRSAGYTRRGSELNGVVLAGERKIVRTRASSARRPHTAQPRPARLVPAELMAVDMGHVERPTSRGVALSIKSLKSKMSKDFTICERDSSCGGDAAPLLRPPVDIIGHYDMGSKRTGSQLAAGLLPLLSDYDFAPSLLATTAAAPPQRALSSRAQRDELLLRKFGYREDRDPLRRQRGLLLMR